MTRLTTHQGRYARRNDYYRQPQSACETQFNCQPWQVDGHAAGRFALDRKVESLLAQMTLEEKVGQMTLYTSDRDTTGPSISSDYEQDIRAGRVGALLNAYDADFVRGLQRLAVEESRLGIPLLFGYDVVHGFRTIFPVPLGQAASWDTAMIERAERVAATEATAAGLNWVYAPMVDISRDPRWGRVVEGAGEDPLLGSRIAAARVRGFQGADLAAPDTALACVKHFAAYGAVQAGREYNTVDLSEWTLRRVYLPPYKAAVDAGVGSVMTAFNTLNGVPATANHFLFTEILREEWGFEGFSVTDYTAILELIQHGVAADRAEAGRLAAEAGVDMDMVSGIFEEELPRLVREGKVPEARINDAARRILRTKFALGLFDDPYRYISAERQQRETLTPYNRRVARELAQESMVLLKNDAQTLPLSADSGRIAVIGPLVQNRADLLGPWHGAGQAEDVVSLWEGLQQHLGDSAELTYAYGTSNAIGDTDTSGFDEAVSVANDADVVILAVGEKWSQSGEASSRAHIDLPGMQPELVQRIVDTGKPVVMVLMNGRPLVLPPASDNIAAILETWFAGVEAGPAIADVLFGAVSPSGKLPMTFPRDVGQIPLFYNHLNTGRPYDPDNSYTSHYLDVSNSPRYPFGYGLSYTQFDYSPITLGSDTLGADDVMTVSVTLTNSGERAGTEVVQLYLRDLNAEVSLPVKELKDFRRIHLAPGASQQVTFRLTCQDLTFLNERMQWVTQPGRFRIFVGSSSDDVQQAEFTYTG